MSTLAEIADKNINCSDASAETGTLGCQIEFSTPLHAIGMKKGMVMPKSTVFDKTYINAQIQLGNFIPMIGADSFEDVSSEDTMNTNTRGIDRLSMSGLPKYKFTYMLGHEFYKQIAKLTSFKSMDFIFADAEGNWKVAVNSNGDYQGFSVGQVLAHMTKARVQGGEPESKSISMQMLNREQWDKNYAILERSLLTFSPEEIDGVNRVVIKLDPIAAAATTVTFSIKLGADNNTPVLGWSATDLALVVNGVEEAITGVVEGLNGNYTGTIGAVASLEKVQVISMDDALETRAVIISDSIFKGESNVVTVT